VSSFTAGTGRGLFWSVCHSVGIRAARSGDHQHKGEWVLFDLWTAGYGTHMEYVSFVPTYTLLLGEVETREDK